MDTTELFFDDAKRQLLALVFATARLQIALAIIPLFAKGVVPGLARTGIGVAFSLLLVPPLSAQLAAQGMPGVLSIAGIVLKEGMLGFLLGYAVACLFWGVEAIGFLVDNQRGASIASTLNPLTGNDSSPLGILFNQAFIVYFLVAGGLFVFLTLFYESHHLWPVLSFNPDFPAEGSVIFAGLFESVIRLGLLLSAPVLVAMLLAEIGLALVSRFAPQLQVFFLAMPVKSAVAFFVFAVYVPTLFSYLQAEVRHLPSLLETLSGAIR